MNRSDKALRRHITSEDLSSYLDGQLSARQREQLEKHIHLCSTCSQELETLRYTTNLLKAMPSVPVPRAFTLSEADVGRSAAHSPSLRFSTYLRGASAALAALLVVVVVGDMLQTTSGKQVQQIASAPRAAMATEAIEAPAELVIEKEIVTPVEGDLQIPVEEAPRAAMVQEPPTVFKETPPPQPQAKAVEEYAAPSEPVVAEETVEVEAATEKPPEISALSITAESEAPQMGGGGPPDGAPLGFGGGGSGPSEVAPLGIGGGGPPEGEAHGLGGEPPEPEMQKVVPTIHSAEEAAQETEQPQVLDASKESATAQSVAGATEPTSEDTAEVQMEKAAAAGPAVPDHLPTPQPSATAIEPLPSPTSTARIAEATAPIAPYAEPRPTPIPLRSPTAPASQPQEVPGGWWTPLRLLEIGLGGVAVVFLLLSIWFRRR